MAQVILAISNTTLRDLISINLRSYMAATIIPRETAADVTGLLALLPQVDLVISDGYSKERNERSGEIIEKYINENSLEVALILLGPSPGVSDDVVIVETASDWEKVVDEASRIMGVTISSLKENVLPSYIAVEPSYFFALEKSCCDVYIRIKKGPSDYQYIKRIHSDDAFLAGEIDKYIKQGLTFFYIEQNNEKEFYTYVSNTLVNLLDTQGENLEEKIKYLALGQDIAIKDLKRMGFTSNTLQLTESVIKGMQSSIQEAKELSILLNKIIGSPKEPIYQLSHLTLQVCSEILNNRKSNVEKNLERLSFACFFKDASLINNQKLCLIYDRKCLDAIQHNEDEWSLVFTHAANSADLLRNYPEAPIDCDTIVRHHHGSPSGRGFETDKMGDIHEDARLLIVAETFAQKVLEYQISRKLDKPLIDLVDDIWGANKYLSPIVKELRQALTKRQPKK